MRSILDIENSPQLLGLDPIVLEHPAINPRVLALELQPSLWRYSFQHIVIIAVRAVFVAVLKLLGVFAESFLALLACEGLVRISKCLVGAGGRGPTISVCCARGWLSVSA